MGAVLFKWFFASLLIGTAGIHTNDRHIAAHPFYVSVTEISHNAAEKNLEISCKIFTDDFEEAILKASGVKLDLINPRDKAIADKQVSDYVRKHLVIKLDGKPAVLEFVGFEREDEAIWTYLQVSNTAAPKKVDIGNNLLYESFDKQINLMHVSVGGNRKSTKLNYPDANASFQF